MVKQQALPAEDALGEIAREQVELLELLWEPPLTSLTIGGVEHPIGELTPLQVADLTAYAEHCARYSRSTRRDKVLLTADLVPTRALQHLLHAGNPDVDFSKIRTHVGPEHIAAASEEMVRQAVAQAVADPALGASRATVLTSDFAGRENRAA